MWRKQVKQVGTTNSGTASYTYAGVSANQSSEYNNLSVADDGVTYGSIYWSNSTTISFKIGSRSGTSITWGSAITISSGNSDNGSQLGLVYNSEAQCFIATYNKNQNYNWRAVSITYSGTTATLVTDVLLEGNYVLARSNDVTYDSDNKVCVAIANTQNAPNYIIGYVL